MRSRDSRQTTPGEATTPHAEEGAPDGRPDQRSDASHHDSRGSRFAGSEEGSCEETDQGKAEYAKDFHRNHL